MNKYYQHLLLIHYVSIIIGFLIAYGLLQSGMWGVLHSVFLFWAVVFPFSYRQLRISGRIRYAHIISVVLAVVIPFPFPLIHLIDGYLLTFTFPVLLCVCRNPDHTYYTITLPISILLCITSCLLVLILWAIFKVHETILPSLHLAFPIVILHPKTFALHISLITPRRACAQRGKVIGCVCPYI